MTLVIAVIAALGAAFLFAVASVVQQGVARSSTEQVLRPRLLLDLLGERRWLAGVALDVLSFVIFAVALAYGPLALVQPIAALDVLFALPLIARRQHRRLTAQDGIGALIVAGGIVVFLAVSTPTGGQGVPSLADWMPVFVAVAAVIGVSAAVALRVTGRPRVVWLGVAAGAIFGVLDALTKSTVDLLAADGAAVLLKWEPYALIAAAGLGALLSQSAFSAGALSLSLPVIDTLAPITAVVIAATVFGEQLASAPWQLGVQLAGGAVAVAGIALLARSSIVAAETTDVHGRVLSGMRPEVVLRP